MKHFILFLLVILSLKTLAQDYNAAATIRIGTFSGVSYKYFVNSEKSYEAMLTFKNGGAQITLLKEIHQPIFMSITNQLFLYYGYGAHCGFTRWSSKVVEINGEKFLKKQTSIAAGLDFVLVMEYHFIKYPFAISFEVKPIYEIGFPKIFHQNFNIIATGLKYTF